MAEGMGLGIDQVPVIGRIGPRVDGVDTPFWDGLAEGTLRMQRCPGCGTWWWAPVWRCGACGSWELRWEPTPAEGRVFSWVRTHQAFVPEMKPIVPYVTLLVELPAAGCRRLCGILVGSETGLRIGAPVTGLMQQPSELTSGRPVLRWSLTGD